MYSQSGFSRNIWCTRDVLQYCHRHDGREVNAVPTTIACFYFMEVVSKFPALSPEELR